MFQTLEYFKKKSKDDDNNLALPWIIFIVVASIVVFIPLMLIGINMRRQKPISNSINMQPMTQNQYKKILLQRYGRRKSTGGHKKQNK